MIHPRWLLPALVVAVFGTGCDRPEAADPGDTAAHPVRVATAEAVANERVRAFVGRLEARRTVDLAFEIPGRVATLPHSTGTVVPAGDLLAALDDTDERREVRRARVDLELAEKSFARSQELLASRADSQARYDDAEARRDLAVIALEAAEHRLTQTRLHAPFPARVTRRLVEAHTQVEPGHPVLRIQDVSEMRLRAELPAAVVTGLLDGAAVARPIDLPQRPGEPIGLELREYVPEANPLADTYSVLFALTDGDPADPLPGRSVTLEIVVDDGRTNDRSNGPAGARVPAAALAHADDGSPRMWVYDPARGSVHPRAVSVRPGDARHIHVDSGIVPGEQVVTAGKSALRDGLEVRPLPHPVQ